MHFPQNYNRHRGGTKKVVAVLFAVALVVCAVVQPVFLTKVFLSIARPLHLVRQDTVGAAAATVGEFSSRADLIGENKRLADELQKAMIKADLFDELRGSMQRKDSSATGTRTISARVLSSPPFSPYDTLIIDAGTYNGVSVNDTVVYDSTVVLGRVDTVTSTTARVELFSSPGIEQSVRIGTHNFLVSARGSGGGAFQMLVLKEEPVSRGDGVFLPDGRLLARVDAVIQDETDAFALVSAVVPFNIFEIRDVTVERNY